MTLSPFQVYWKSLKESDPAEYQSRLKKNRDRLHTIRKAIYADPDKHAAHLKRERERYARRRDARQAAAAEAAKVQSSS
jgi:DNA replication initiation complex subunit (GINS family)